MTDIECVFESMSKKGSIFISNFAAAQDLHLLQSKGIKAILSVARSGLVHHSKQDVPYYLYLPAEDHEEYEIYKFFNQTYDFIEQSRKQTNVLVHCMAGISRSVTIVIAYLLKKFKCSLREVLTMLHRKRNKINPNKGFIEQLKKYAQQQGLKCSFQNQPSMLKEKEDAKQKINERKISQKKIQYSLTNPLDKHYSDKINDKSTFQKTIPTKEDINDLSKKSDQLKKEMKLLECPLNAQECESSKLKIVEPFLPLKKRYSFDIKSPTTQEKISIQQKITKVREKILQREKLKKSFNIDKSDSQQKKVKSKEGNIESLKSILSNKKSAHKQLSEYFSLYGKEKAMSNSQQKSLARLYVQPIQPDQLQFEKYVCQTESPMHAKVYKADSRNLYSKLHPKKISQRNNC